VPKRIAPVPELSEDNPCPTALARWRARHGTERSRQRTEQSLRVSKEEIAATGYDLSRNRHKEVVRDEVEPRAPLHVIADLERMESEVEQALSELKALL
jgi:type I restriction enzyme M protein